MMENGEKEAINVTEGSGLLATTDKQPWVIHFL